VRDVGGHSRHLHVGARVVGDTVTDDHGAHDDRALNDDDDHHDGGTTGPATPVALVR